MTDLDVLAAVADTFRYIGRWGDDARTPAELAGVADGIAELRDSPRGSFAWLCCPVCQEIECDGDCPLRVARRAVA